jgi:hypothetical protein
MTFTLRSIFDVDESSCTNIYIGSVLLGHHLHILRSCDLAHD